MTAMGDRLGFGDGFGRGAEAGGLPRRMGWISGITVSCCGDGENTAPTTAAEGSCRGAS